MSATGLSSLVFALPLALAAALVLAGPKIPRRLADLTVILVAATAAGISLELALRPHATVSWLGGWRPRAEAAVGIALVADPVAAGLAGLAATLVAAALVFSWRYFDAVQPFFHALMLVFLAGMTGFALSGDLFTMFVFFELMGVAAYALTAYLIEREAPLQAALNFGVINSVGAFLLLIGITLVYGRTGTLNLARAGEALARGPVDGLVVTAFVLVTVGLLVKAAAVPFHFWLADAHAAAPTPVCVLFSGVMVELGLYGFARVYWTVFSGPFALHGDGLRAVLVILGTASALVGGVMCVLQHHLKRLLAFSTVSHGGLFLIGVALLDARALAGSAIYVLGHGAAKAALFLATGILLHRHDSVDEGRLHGRGRGMHATRGVFVVGALALAGVPPFSTFLGKSVVEEAARSGGYGWVTVVFLGTAALTAGAVSRVAVRVFWGWGRPAGRYESSEEEGEEDETVGAAGRVPAVMLVPAILLVAASLALGLVPHLTRRVESATAGFTDRPVYVAAVLGGRVGRPVVPRSPPTPPSAYALAAVAALAALAVAVVPLRARRRPALVGAVSDLLHELHSGHVGDYLAWLTAGTATLGLALALTVR